MGRWSRLIAPLFVTWLAVPRRARWLDVGCGTGALTSAICEHADPLAAVGCDPAAPFIAYAREHVRDERASFVAAGVGALPAIEDGYGSVTSLFALNFFPEPEEALVEMRDLTVAGGRVSACVWDYAEGMEFLHRFWEAAGALDPAARELDEGRRFPICRSESLVDLFRKAGVRDARCDAIEITTEFSGFDDFWSPFLGGTGPAPSYVESLAPDRRAALAGKLDATLPRRGDGSIVLAARAWAVCGTVKS